MTWNAAGINMPNLEQAGLLLIGYTDRVELAEPMTDGGLPFILHPQRRSAG